ncbi:MAG: L-threonylcarbamoyladenylate synthase [Candidatus Porifericomitaceae bacterium WSBS_2022_MAG_OTU9]
MTNWRNLQLPELSKWRILEAAAIIKDGGLVACPTEGVWGFSCDPGCDDAILRLLLLKRRCWSSGLIIVASDLMQLEQWIDRSAITPDAWSLLQQGGPVTWIVPATDAAPRLVRGGSNTLAVRISLHPLLQALCSEAGPIVSTSANISGGAPISSKHVVQCVFGRSLDMIVAGAVGDLSKPTEIRELIGGKVLRGHQ